MRIGSRYSGENASTSPPRTLKSSSLFGLRHPLVAACRERFDQCVEVKPVANRDSHNRFVEGGARNRARHQRFSRSHYERRLMPKHREQRRQLRRLRVGGRRQLRHRLHFPRAQQMHPAGGGVGVGRLIEKQRDLAGERSASGAVDVTAMIGRCNRSAISRIISAPAAPRSPMTEIGVRYWRRAALPVRAAASLRLRCKVCDPKYANSPCGDAREDRTCRWR